MTFTVAVRGSTITGGLSLTSSTVMVISAALEHHEYKIMYNNNIATHIDVMLTSTLQWFLGHKLRLPVYRHMDCSHNLPCPVVQFGRNWHHSGQRMTVEREITVELKPTTWKCYWFQNQQSRFCQG